MGYLDYPGLQRYHGKVQEEIDELKDDLSELTGDEQQQEITDWIYGTWINTGNAVEIGDTVNITNLTEWFSLKHVIVECQEGDKFLLDITGATNARAYAFLTSSNVLLSRSDAGQAISGYITAPPTAGKVIIQGVYRQTPEDPSDDGTAYKIVGGTGKVVRFDIVQNKTEAEKERARTNIGVIGTGGLSDAAKIALLDCFKHVYWMDHESDYYGALEEALYDEPVPPTPTPLYNWDLTKSLTDTISGQIAVLKNNWNGTLPTRDASGVHFNGYGQSIQLFGDTATLEQTLKNRTIQVDVASFTPNSANNNYHTRFIMFSKSKADIDNQVFNVGIIYRHNGNPAQWSMYTCDPSAASGSWGSGFGITNRNAISGHTVSVYIGNDYKPKLYIDDQSYGTGNLAFYPNMVGLFVGSNDTAGQGATFYDALVTGVRIYEGDVINGI